MGTVAETTTGLLVGFEQAKACKILVAVSAVVSAAIETDELDVFITLLTFWCSHGTKFSEESSQNYGIDGCFTHQCMGNLTCYIIVMTHL